MKTTKTSKKQMSKSFWHPSSPPDSPQFTAIPSSKPSSKSACPKSSSLSTFWLPLFTLFAGASMLRYLLFWQSGAFPNPCTDDCETGSTRGALELRYPGVRSFSVSSHSDSVQTHHVTVKGQEWTELERLFWKQPDDGGLVGCVEGSASFQAESAMLVAKERRKYLMVVVNGGLNQQRNQIVDAVVMARVLGATLVVPVLEVNPIWEDESEFSDIFDLEHFKETLKDDVRIVSSLPSTHVMIRPMEEKHTPLNASPQWLRQHYQGKISREGVLLLRGMDSRLSKALSPDLQKLRCKVAFQALRFAPPLASLGRSLALRMASRGPFVALHLRLELDVWVRTGCLPGLGKAWDEKVREERREHPGRLTGKGAKMGSTERKRKGLCPLTAAEVARLLKALGASPRTRIYWAGGEPLGGKELALQPLRKEFPNVFNKDSLATPQELEPFKKKASSLAAIDYLVCLYSDVFLQSHGGNFGRVMQGHRAFMGHRKHIVPNKRLMIPHFLNTTMPPGEFDETIRALHADAVGKLVQRTANSSRDVLAYPFPECMCRKPNPSQRLSL